MNRFAPLVMAVFAIASCSKTAGNGRSLREERAGFSTSVFGGNADRAPAPAPPEGMFELVRYPAPLGTNAAYITPAGEGKRPAILWVAGGFDWSIGEGSWLPSPRDNDQSASAFREAGIVLMRPALRGSNDNPGRNECFFGEVDDLLAAAEYLASRADVDPNRIYLGGHSTGGTLALLAAEVSDRFRAVFSFGPVADPRSYGDFGCLPSGVDDKEARVRAPGRFVDRIRSPTFIIEGQKSGNAQDALLLAQDKRQAPVRAVIVPGADHFSVLRPGTELIARAILADQGPQVHIDLTAADLVRSLEMH